MSCLINEVYLSYDLYAWQCFHAFHANGMLAGPNGVIYGVTEDARLLWYHHTGQPDGSANWAHPDGKVVGSRPPPHPDRSRSEHGRWSEARTGEID